MSSKRALTERQVQPEIEKSPKKVKFTPIEEPKIKSHYDLEHLDHDAIICFFRDDLKLDETRLRTLNSSMDFPLDGVILKIVIQQYLDFNTLYNVLKPYFLQEETSKAASIVAGKLIDYFNIEKPKEYLIPIEAQLVQVMKPPKTPVEAENYYNFALQLFNDKYGGDRNRYINNETFVQQIDSVLEQVAYSFNTMSLEKKEGFARALPIKNGEFAKHYLPFITSLHITDLNDAKLESLSSNNVVIMSPSGMGKTSLMIRSLCKHPGLLITGTGPNEYANGETVDESVRKMMNCFRSVLEAYAYIRQSILLLMIAKLSHILNLIDSCNIDRNILEPFEGNLFAFLAFNQFNGSNKHITPIFEKLFTEFKGVSCDYLRKYASDLIEKVKIKTNSAKFLICVDEANVFEETSYYDYYSINGNKTGALWCNEIIKVNGKGLNIYAGTSFSIRISDIVQSNLGKTESELKSMTLVEFEYFSRISFIDYLKRHINIDCSIETEENFPLRIRHAALCLEYYINYRLAGESKSIETCLEESFSTLIKALTNKANDFIGQFPLKEDFRSLYKAKLMDYVVHHKNQETCGSSFYVPKKDIAVHFLSSGIACPVAATLKGKQIEFWAIDVLGYRFAKQFLRITSPNSERYELAQFIGNTDCRKRFELSLCMALTAANGKLKNLINLSKNINQSLKSKLSQVDFNCEKILTNNGFFEHCVKKQWIKNTDTTPGDMLYFNFAVNHKERIANILFRPSDKQHDDAMLALMTGSELVFLRFSFKCLTGKDKHIDFAYKSTLPELMFFDNYKDVTLQKLNTLVNKNHTKILSQLKVETISKMAQNLEFSFCNGEILFEQFLSEYANNSLSVIFHPTTDVKQNRESKLYHNAVFIHNPSRVEKFLGHKYTQDCFVPFLETMKKLDKEKVPRL